MKIKELLKNIVKKLTSRKYKPGHKCQECGTELIFTIENKKEPYMPTIRCQCGQVYGLSFIRFAEGEMMPIVHRLEIKFDNNGLAIYQDGIKMLEQLSTGDIYLNGTIKGKINE
jgi:uncharacterized Zn finger protein